MRFRIFVGLLFHCAIPALAVEGPTAAGPNGGSDIRAAMMPPPGVYGGVIAYYTETTRFVGEDGAPVPALSEAQLAKGAGAALLFWVPDQKIWGGAVGIAVVVPTIGAGGHLFPGEQDQTAFGLGDPYVEAAWSTSRGFWRASQDAGAFPIFEGLSLQVGLGAVVPVGRFTSKDPTAQSISPGSNIWDVAPSVALTYTTPPILFEGTEISAKLYWNNYFRNPDTRYLTGDVLNVDFAVTEHVGRFQIGVAGSYGVQVSDDQLGANTVLPNGNRGELFVLGGLINYDIPETGSAIKFKASSSVEARNLIESWAVALTYLQKF